MSSPPNPPGRFEKKYSHRPSAENAGSKSLAGELNGAGSGGPNAAGLLGHAIRRSHPPAPPGRSVDPHSTIEPSGLAASRISPYGLEMTPGATSSAGEVIASEAGVAVSVIGDGWVPPHA